MEGTIGEMRIVAYDFAPRTWAFCNGQVLAINSNTALFAIIGTMYGGDGRTTFALPDYRGRVPLSHGQGAGLPDYTIGETTGTETETITLAEMAAHTHFITHNLTGTFQRFCNNDDANNVSSPQGNYPSLTSDPLYASTTEGAFSGSLEVIIGGSMSLGNTGGGQSHNNMQPFITMHYVICEQGVFPSRG